MRKLGFISFAMLVAVTSQIWAQPPSSPQTLSPDLEAIKLYLERVKTELNQVKRQQCQLLQIMLQCPALGVAASEPTGPVRVSITDAPILGRHDAPVTLVEFSDYECPFCQ